MLELLGIVKIGPSLEDEVSAMAGVSEKITDLIKLWKQGDKSAEAELLNRVYSELKKISSGYLKREKFHAQHWQTTDLVGEAYLRLLEQKELRLHDRKQFYAIVAKLMRQLLIENARQRKAEKRGGGLADIALDDQIEVADQKWVDLFELEEALKAFEKLDARKCRIVELRFFGGLSLEEISEVLEISPATVKRDWNMARAWLFRYLFGK